MSLVVPARQGSRGSRALYVAILVTNLVVFLFPPIHLVMNEGDMIHALIYFLGAPIVLVISMFVLLTIDPNRCPEDES